MKRVLAVTLAVGGALAPAAARACAVCSAGDPNRASFLWTTVLLSLLPLGMFAGGLWFLWRAARGRLADEFADPDAPRLPAERRP